jgi:nicotinamide-nucleotide amidase
MSAEIVCVGTEMLLGQITNTNARDLSESLASIGVDVYRHTVVGDNPKRIQQALRDALARSEAVLVTGGLGPTPDDITSEAVAAVLGRRLVRDERLVRVIRGVFEDLGRAMPETNLKQADLPEGAVPIEPQGTAPGYYIETNENAIFVLPGVPWEMKGMMDKAVLPALVRRFGAAATVSHEVLVVGLGESLTHQRISDLVEAQSNPTIAYLAGRGQVRVRITAKAPDEDAARALIDPVEKELRARLGDAVVPGEGSFAARFGAMLEERGETVGVAESLTGGLIGAELAEAPGASSYFKGAVVCYSTESKAAVVGVPEDLLHRHGPVSRAAAAALAEGAARVFGATLGLSATGVAGPKPQDELDPGTIFVGAHRAGATEVRRIGARGDRTHIRSWAVTAAIDLGRRMIQE